MNLNHLVRQARDARTTPVDPFIADALCAISRDGLRATVDALAFPRHFEAQPEANRQARDYVADRLRALGYSVWLQGNCDNVVALQEGVRGRPLTLLGAHYDSVPETPGADDNASAVAGLLACAEAVSRAAPDRPVVFVAFNREETDLARSRGLFGSEEFVRGCVARRELHVRAAHVFEMIGYADAEPGSQQAPPGVPIALPSAGDWLGLLGNASSSSLLGSVLGAARTYVPQLDALGVAIPRGLDALFPVLRRSDHYPFWVAGVPALLWTDTAEFRNPHYHKASDTPDTLDYDFLASVARTALACLLGGAA